MEVLTARYLFSGRPLGPQDYMRGCPAFEVLARTVRQYSSSVMYQNTQVSAMPFSGCTKSFSQFDQLINATGYVLKKFVVKIFAYSNLDEYFGK